MATGRANEGGFVVLCALPPEAVAARAGLTWSDRRSRRMSRTRGTVRLTGMGPLRARRASARLASSLPDGLPVVVLGVGGALDAGFAAGDLVVGSAFGTADAGPDGSLEVVRAPVPLDDVSSAFACRLADALSDAFPSTTMAPMLSAGRTAKGRERAALARSGAVICDTESAWLARLSERRPFAVVRSIVDTPERELVSLQTVTGGVIGLKRLGEAAAVIADVLA